MGRQLAWLNMQKMHTGAAIGLLVAAISFSAPSAAFALRLGPLHIGLPFFAHPFAPRHRPAPQPDVSAEARIYDSSGNPEAAGNESAQTAPGPASALLYPALALPTIYDDLFRPASSSPWPFDYEAIFHAAFGKTAGDQDRRPCRSDRGSAALERIGNEIIIRPSAAQRPLLQKLGGAFAMASGFLTKFCPKEIPSRPVARLQLMETQIEALTMALDIIRQPLQDFEQSLNRNQQAHLAATLSAPSAGSKNEPADMTLACATAPTTVDWSIDEINQSLQPNDPQLVAMAATKQAFDTAARDLNLQCPMPLQATLLARLDATQARLDAEWRAVLTIQVALANLESRLSDDQRVRFNALDFVARGPSSDR